MMKLSSKQKMTDSFTFIEISFILTCLINYEKLEKQNCFERFMNVLKSSRSKFSNETILFTTIINSRYSLEKNNEFFISKKSMSRIFNNESIHIIET